MRPAEMKKNKNESSKIVNENEIHKKWKPIECEPLIHVCCSEKEKR